MSELTATVTEARANFSKIAKTVNVSKRPVTILRNSKPWVVISPASDKIDAPIPKIDWSKQNIIEINSTYGHAILPNDLDDNDKDLYDVLI